MSARVPQFPPRHRRAWARTVGTTADELPRFVAERTAEARRRIWKALAAVFAAADRVPPAVSQNLWRVLDELDDIDRAAALAAAEAVGDVYTPPPTLPPAAVRHLVRRLFPGRRWIEHGTVLTAYSPDADPIWLAVNATSGRWRALTEGGDEVGGDLASLAALARGGSYAAARTTLEKQHAS